MLVIPNNDYDFKETSATDKIVQVASTLAIEEMHIDNEIINNLLAIANKQKTIEDVIKELDEFYA